MSWKSIEMQVALPRTQDAGKLQEQMSKQNQQFQESLAQNQLKQKELARKQVNKFEEIRKAETKDKQSSAEDSSDNDKQDGDIKEEKGVLDHPYLGSKIDISR